MASTDLLTAMMPCFRCMALWFAFYWVCVLVSKALFPWFSVLKKEQIAYYSKKLKLSKFGLTSEEESRAATSYFQNFFITSILSATNGFIMAYLLVPFVLWGGGSKFLAEAHLDSTAEEVYLACHIFTGYILCDFVFVLPLALKYRIPDDILFVAHHVSLVITWASFLTDGWGHLFAVPTMLTEITSPFVFARWGMNEFRMTSSPLFIVNGLLLVVAWYSLRIFGYTIFLTWRLFVLRSEVLDPTHLERNIAVLFFHALGCYLQINWGWLLTVNALKILGVISDKKKNGAEAKVSKD